MNIGLVIYGALETVSGGYVFDRILVEHLRAQGDMVEVISLRPRGYAGRLFDNLSFRLPSGFDVVLQDELNHPSLLWANAGHHAAPIVSIVHNLRSSEPGSRWQNGLYRIVEQRYLDSVDGFVFNSEETRAAVASLARSTKRFVIAPPGGDRLGTSTSQRVRERAEEQGPLRLLFLANVTRGKGLGVALDALASLPRSAYTLDVVGSMDIEPGYAARMRRKAMEMELTVNFFGALDREALVDRLDCAQVLVLPSFYEGFGIAYLEGMAHGLPGIGTSSGAIPSLISDGENGYLISPGDVKGLAGRLEVLRGDRELLGRLGIAALQSFQRRPTWHDTTTRIRSFLLGVIKARELMEQRRSA